MRILNFDIFDIDTLYGRKQWSGEMRVSLTIKYNIATEKKNTYISMDICLQKIE